MNTKPFQVEYGQYPTGIAVWNNLAEEGGDFQRLAFLSHDGRHINWNKKDLPAPVVAQIKAYAKDRHTPNPAIVLSAKAIQYALEAPHTDRAAQVVLDEAQKRGYVRIHSATQAQWTDEGAAKASAGLIDTEYPALIESYA